MAGTVTFAQLISSSKDRANMEKSTLITDAQWKEYVNKSKDSLYDMLISAYSDEYYVTTYTFNTVVGTTSYALPATFYKLISCSLKSGDDYLRLKKFSYQDRNRNSYLPYRSNLFKFRYEYRVSGDNIVLDPVPSANDTIELIYIPKAVNLVNDNDVLEGFNGWEEYIILDVAIKALRKEESDTSDLERDLFRLTDRLEKMADSRDIGQPAKIIDTSTSRGRRDNGWY